MQPENAEPLMRIQGAMHALLDVDYQQLLSDRTLSPFQSSMAVLASMTVDCFEKALHHPLTPMEEPVNASSVRTTNTTIQEVLESLEQEAVLLGIRRIRPDDSRMIDLGTAQLREMWRCEKDHGHGTCNQPLVSGDAADIVLGTQIEDGVLAGTEYGIISLPWITEQGFGSLELFHLSDVAVEFEGRNGGCTHVWSQSL